PACRDRQNEVIELIDPAEQAIDLVAQPGIDRLCSYTLTELARGAGELRAGAADDGVGGGLIEGEAGRGEPDPGAAAKYHDMLALKPFSHGASYGKRTVIARSAATSLPGYSSW